MFVAYGRRRPRTPEIDCAHSGSIVPVFTVDPSIDRPDDIINVPDVGRSLVAQVYKGIQDDFHKPSVRFLSDYDGVSESSGSVQSGFVW